ncbi:hypothetical protein P3T36_007222 [Kitasatospora sp. MAP12-15]|nr:hypothetical protein [Kitasatospora sp. MAP12-44]
MAGHFTDPPVGTDGSRDAEEQAGPLSGWLPPHEYVESIANATCYGALIVRDEEGRYLGLRSARRASVTEGTCWSPARRS